MRWRRRRRRRKLICARHRRQATVLSASLRSPRGARHRARRCTGSMPPSSPPSPRHLQQQSQRRRRRRRSGGGGDQGGRGDETAARATARTTRSSRRATAVQPDRKKRLGRLSLYPDELDDRSERMIGAEQRVDASRSVKIRFTHFDTRPDHGKRRARSGGDAAHLDTDRPHHEAQWQQLRGRYVPARAGPSVPVTSSTQHGHMSGAMPSKPLTRGPGSTWLRSEFSTAVRRTAASQAFDLPQAPHAYAILVDARVQTAGCVASRLHAVADLEVLGKAQLHRRSQ